MAKIVFFGTPDYVVCVPEALEKAGHNILAVVTQPPRPVGRKQEITPPPVAIWGEGNGIKIIDREIPELIQELKNLHADVGVLAAYGQILPNEVLQIFPSGILNIHPSLLPKYRGASPIQAAILNGEKEIGITIIKMDEQMDHGPIISQEVIEISDSDTTETARTKAFRKGAETLVNILPDYLSDQVRLGPQNHEQATYTWTIKESKDKAYFYINNPPAPEVIERMIRAFYPWPVTWTRWKDKVIKFFPGKRIQMEGKNPATFEEFKRAYPAFPLEI